MQIIAHRGASAQAPENTIAGIHRAWELGADGIEIDILLTKDNVPVAIHDSHTGRVGDRKLTVKDSTLAELKQVDVGSKFSSEFAGERIPTLEEVMAEIPERKYLFIEAKEAHASNLAKALIPIFNQHLDWIAGRQIVFMSFFPDLLWTMAAKFPDLTSLLLLDNARRLPRKIPKKLPSDSLPVHGLGLSSKITLKDEQREALIEAGALLNVWTVNDPDDEEKWADAGFDFLTTDYPELFLAKRNKAAT